MQRDMNTCIPLPESQGEPPAGRSLAALIAGLEDGLVTVRADGVDGIITVVSGRLHSAALRCDGQDLVSGPAALDAMAELSGAVLQARRTSGRLANALAATNGRPPQITGIPMAWFDGEELVCQLIRPGRRGALTIHTGADIGVAVFDEAGLICSYSLGQPAATPDLGPLHQLLSDPDASLTAWLSSEPAPDRPQQPVQARDRPRDQPKLEPDSAPVANPGNPYEQTRLDILNMVGDRLQLHAEPVQRPFRAAATTAEGLKGAAGEIRHLELRLVSAETIAGLAARAEAMIDSA